MFENMGAPCIGRSAQAVRRSPLTLRPPTAKIAVKREGPIHLSPLVAVAALTAAGAQAQEIERRGAPGAPLSASVELPPSSRLVYVSGTVPDPSDPAAPAGTVERFGDTATQTRSVIRKIEAQLAQHGLGLEDIVMMRVFLVAPPGRNRMDFAGMMSAYREFFGTDAQPVRPARSTMQVAGLVDPGWLVEIEVTAATPAMAARP